MMRLVISLLLAGAAVAAATHGRWWQVPDAHNPWSPLVIDATPNWLTRYKLDRLAARPQVCMAVLSGADMQMTAVPDGEPAPGCGFRAAVRISGTRLRTDPPFVLSCRAAVSFAMWERHVLVPEAGRLLGSAPVRLEHYGSYACRNVYGRSEGRRSQHATADALDVAGVVLEDGRRITVARHWQARMPLRRDAGDGSSPDPEPTREAQFLHAVHHGACRFFSGVLGPEYNAAHADHLHLERGSSRICR